MDTKEAKQLVAQLNYRGRKVEELEIYNFGESAKVTFADNGKDKNVLLMTEVNGLSLSIGTKAKVERVSVIDINPMLGNFYCTIMFNNERTVRIMCKKVSIE